MATAKITAELVNSIKPGKADQFVWDTDTKGFGLKVTPKGAKVYVLQYRMEGRGGKTKRYTLGREGPLRPDSARKLARAKLALVADGTDVAAEKRARKRVAVELAFDKYVTAFCDGILKAEWPRSWKPTKQCLDLHAVKHLGSKPLPSITPDDLRGLLRALDPHPATKRNLYAALSFLFNRAVSDGVIPASPLKDIKAPATVKERSRTLSDDELRWLWEATAGEAASPRNIVRMLVLTGQRRSEVAGLPWKELSRETREWHLPAERAKNGSPNIVPLLPEVVAILDEAAGGDKWPRKGFVFPSREGTPVSGFSKMKRRLDKAIQKAAGDEVIDRWTLHDLRRTLATNLQRLGVRFEVTEHLLNHRERTRTGIGKVYQLHDYLPEKRAALERWEVKLASIIAGSTGVVVPFGRTGNPEHRH